MDEFDKVKSLVPEKAGKEALHLLDIGELRANTLRHRMKHAAWHGGNPYESRFWMGLDAGLLSDHGHHHSRHAEKLVEKGVGEYFDTYPDEFDDQDPETLHDFSALMLFPYYHDGLDQQVTAVRNIDYIINRKPFNLLVKKGHAVAAGVMMMALVDEYAQACGIDQTEAWNIVSPAAVMMMRHDEPEKLEKTFAQRNIETEAQLSLHGSELLRLFEADELDLYHLTPAQYIEILTMQKRPHGFIGDFGEEGVSRYGLSPEFEAKYGDILDNLAVEDHPILPDLSQKRRERLKTLTEIAYFADMGDMICPWNMQFCRTLRTDYSKRRPFSVFNGSSQPSVDEAFRAIIDGNGMQASDDTRFLWELYHVNGNKSKLNTLPWVTQFYKDHVMLGLAFLVTLGESIMKTPKLTKKRIERITGKLRDRMMNVWQDREVLTGQREIVDTGKRTEGINVLFYIYAQRALGLREVVENRVGHVQEAEQVMTQEEYYEDRIDIFTLEFSEIMRSLASDEKWRPYTAKDVAKFRDLVLRMIDAVGNHRYGVTDKEFEEYVRIMHEGLPAESQPFVNESVPGHPMRILE